MTGLETGKKAPAFSLPATSGGNVCLKDFAGKKNVVLYFYPKDMTSGCTIQAGNFRDLKSEFDKAGTEILGVSKDDLKRHDKFTQKENLNFTLLSDESLDMLKNYCVWQEKKMAGNTYMGIVRTTFVIDKEGKIAKIWPKVKVAGHVDEVLDYVKNM